MIFLLEANKKKIELVARPVSHQRAVVVPQCFLSVGHHGQRVTSGMRLTCQATSKGQVGGREGQRISQSDK